MTTKRLPFQASTLCAGGTLLVLGSFLALNLAGCGGSSNGPVNPTPSTTATPIPAALQFLLQLLDGSTATGGTVTLTAASGRTYTANANSQGLASLRNVVPGLYTLVFKVKQANGTLVSTTRSITITSPTSSGVQSFTLRQGDTGNSNPFTITGRILLNPAGTNDPDGNSNTANCPSVIVPITDAVIVTVRDLNATNGTPIIAQITRAAQPASTPGTQRGVYTITIPYQPTAFQVSVTNSNDAPFAGLSASTSFPKTVNTVNNVDVCTNASTTAPQPSVTTAPSATPFATATTVGTPSATATPTPVQNPTATTVPPPTSTPVPTATPVPTNTPIPGSTPFATNTPSGTPTNTPTGT
ncbi:hypothetical protein IAD21_04275 [Abditibacteriota bacterium]|nr:hypothetical protein IAD21_04275 [Abditibacteriota bacterium]